MNRESNLLKSKWKIRILNGFRMRRLTSNTYEQKVPLLKPTERGNFFGLF